MSSTSLLSKNLPPLAERIRPQVFSDFTGQTSLIRNNSILSKAVTTNQPFSLIFWGPPGTGKTTLARILSREFGADYFELSAISSGVKQVREVRTVYAPSFSLMKFTALQNLSRMPSFMLWKKAQLHSWVPLQKIHRLR